MPLRGHASLIPDVHLHPDATNNCSEARQETKKKTEEAHPSQLIKAFTAWLWWFLNDSLKFEHSVAKLSREIVEVWNTQTRTTDMRLLLLLLLPPVDFGLSLTMLRSGLCRANKFLQVFSGTAWPGQWNVWPFLRGQCHCWCCLGRVSAGPTCWQGRKRVAPH